MATRSNKLHTPGGTATWVSLLTPRQKLDKLGKPKGDPKYQITLVFDEDTDLDEMKAAAQAAGEEKFGAKFMAMTKNGKANWPFSDNDDRLDDDGQPMKPFSTFPGGVHVGFKSGDKPGIVDADAEPIMDKSDIYSGMSARVSCRPFAYDNESKGVAFYLINVQKLDDGERLSGNPSAEDDFKPVKGKKAPAKPVKGLYKKKPASDVDDYL